MPLIQLRLFYNKFKSVELGKSWVPSGFRLSYEHFSSVVCIYLDPAATGVLALTDLLPSTFISW